MADKQTSQSQHNGTASQHQGDAFRKMIDDQLGRVASFWTELEKLETKGLEQARAAIDESARLAKEGMVYAAGLAAEWIFCVPPGAKSSPKRSRSFALATVPNEGWPSARAYGALYIAPSVPSASGPFTTASRPY